MMFKRSLSTVARPVLRARRRLFAALILTLAAGLAAGAASATPWSGWTWLGPEGGSFAGVVRVPGLEDTYYVWTDQAGVFRSTDGGRSWQAVSRGLRRSDGGQVRVPEVVAQQGGDSLYVADRVLWRHGSGPWEAVAVPDAATTLRFDPRNPQLLWLGAATGLYRSADGGESWEQRSDGLVTGYQSSVRHIEVSADGSVLYAVNAAYPAAVYHSTDAGLSWTRVHLDLRGHTTITCLVSDPGRPRTVYACVDRFGLYRSRDGGLSWQVVLQDGGTAGNAVAMATASPDVVWFAGGSGLFRSTDGGDEWNQVLFGQLREEARGVAVSADGTTVLVTSPLGLWRSTDGGFAWESVERGLRAADLRRVSGSPLRPEDLFGIDGLLLRSRDGGATWERSLPPDDFFIRPVLYAPGPVASPADPRRVYLATGRRLFRSDDAGDTWTATPPGPGGDYELLLPHRTEVDSLVASGSQGLFHSADGGESWQPAFVPDQQQYRSFHAGGGSTDPTDPDRLYVLGSQVDAHHTGQPALLASSDGGSSFHAVYEPSGFDAVAVDAQGTVYVTDAGPAGKYRLIYSRNGGLSWNALGPLAADASPGTLKAHPSRPRTLVVSYAFDGPPPHMTTDGGASWQPLDLTGLPDPWPRVHDVYWRGGDEPRLYLATAGGLYAQGADDCPQDSPGALCLGDGRYEVRARWRTAGGRSGIGKGVPLTADTGYFWFFRQANVELLVKVLDACGTAGRIWAFAGGLTNVEVELEVLDRRTGARRLYVNPQQTPFAPVQDTGAFASCPPEHAFAMAAAAARPSASPRAAAESGPVLSLAGGRYEVRVDWATDEAESGPATAVPLSDDTGYFWFFRDSNVELVVKVLDGCAVNQRYWIFAGGLTNVGTEITVTDTLTGVEHTYATTPGPAFAPLQDTTTFATCP